MLAALYIILPERYVLMAISQSGSYPAGDAISALGKRQRKRGIFTSGLVALETEKCWRAARNRRFARFANVQTRVLEAWVFVLIIVIALGSSVDGFAPNVILHWALPAILPLS